MMGRKNYRKTKMKITTKNAISKSELREARKREESQINEAISSKREIRNQQNKKEKADMLATAKNNDISLVEVSVNNETIINEYENKMSISTIANTHGMKNSDVLSILICNAYSEGMSMVKCSEKFEISYRQVQNILKENNVKIRPKGFQKKTENKDDDELTKEIINESSKNENLVNQNIDDASFNIKVNYQDEDTSVNKKNDLIPTDGKIVFCEQSYSNEKLNKIEFGKYSQDVVVAGLCRNRHNMPVNKYIFDTLTEKEINDPKYIESRALGFINAYVRPKPTMPAKTLVLYCTGFALALSTIVKICVQNKVNLLTMHWNPHTDSYTPQNTVDIFGKVPTIDEISPLKGLENKYKGGVYLFGCKTKRLIEQGKCTFISLQDDYYPDRNNIVLFPCEFPTDEVWKFYVEMIKMSRNEGFIKRQYIQIGLMDVSLSGYVWGDVVSKSYNWRDEKPTTKRIIG